MKFWTILRLAAATVFASVVVASCLLAEVPGPGASPPAPRAAPVFQR